MHPAMLNFYWLLDGGPPGTQVGTFCTRKEHNVAEHERGLAPIILIWFLGQCIIVVPDN